ncbi:hypothetical protein B1J93_19305 [Leptospira kirschneri serovar Pomona]|uniref:Uncharacterized protein n=1 Tax=Leptospira kirschneri serovar Pomona TaxID=561005 RepID=A0A1T1DG08_9LEPT|nr:hypothetical protein B1J93_19305 [Leptospira kirschneri serovar Pomona]
MPILREAFAEFSGALWKLSASLPKGRSGNSAKRFLLKRFRVNKLNLNTIVVLCFLYAIY